MKWLRGQTRTRNGASKGKRAPYKVGGVKFVLSTCRTAFNWANRRRMLPPYSTNPFAAFPIDKLKDREGDGNAARLFTPAQEQAFFQACSEWQRGIFRMLATYGLRVGELTHLLIEDIDFEAGTIAIRSKPELFWTVKTGRRRLLPLVPLTRTLLERLVGERKAGFVFLNEPYAAGKCQPASAFPTPRSLQMHLQRLVTQLASEKPDATEREKRRHVVAFCRSIGQIPEKRVRDEFIKLTAGIGCPELTRAHDLRHLFSSRAQEAGLNPLLVQELLGHTTLEMTRRYTHLGVETKRAALESLPRNHPRGLGESEEESSRNITSPEGLTARDDRR